MRGGRHYHTTHHDPKVIPVPRECVPGSYGKCPECGDTLRVKLDAQLHNCDRWLTQRTMAEMVSERGVLL